MLLKELPEAAKVLSPINSWVLNLPSKRKLILLLVHTSGALDIKSRAKKEQVDAMIS